MKILFAFENPLPSREADAEVFLATARHLAPLASCAWLHVPRRNGATNDAAGFGDGMTLLRAWAPTRFAALRHLCCGLTLVLRREYRRADLIYTRNLWVAWMAVAFGQRVAFDHYRPWPEQIPPLQLWLYRLLCRRRFLVNICHSDYTREKYLSLGVPPDKLRCVRNGFDPRDLGTPVAIDAAKRAIGVASDVKTVVYTGRLNHKKGLGLVVAAARQLPDVQFILVGSYGKGPIEAMAAGIANIRIVPWQSRETLGHYLFAANILLIPPSYEPLARFGSTVLPLKLFLYMASNRPIVAGDTADVGEVLRHRHNALLCRPDCVDALVAGIRELTSDTTLAASIAATALAESRAYTWHARAQRIMEILTERMASASNHAGNWGPAQTRIWHRQSWRWFVHGLHRRSFVLSADVPPYAPAVLPAQPGE